MSVAYTPAPPAPGPNAALDAAYLKKSGDAATGVINLDGFKTGRSPDYAGWLGLDPDGSAWAAGSAYAMLANQLTGALSMAPPGTFILYSGATPRLQSSPVGVGLNGNGPTAKAAAIASPTADAAALKTAVDAIRVALTNIGITV